MGEVQETGRVTWVPLRLMSFLFHLSSSILFLRAFRVASRQAKCLCTKNRHYALAAQGVLFLCLFYEEKKKKKVFSKAKTPKGK